MGFLTDPPTLSGPSPEIDPNSTHVARGTISRNFLTPRITLVQTTADGPIFAPLADEGVIIAWTMCNPPFYDSQDEIDRLAGAKELAPHAVRPPFSSLPAARALKIDD